ncbi:MAG: PASTA domain-containing protein [Nitrospirae bacterium]|nr:PASTA domain-containing protein [Nitrospirota bacterium]
MEDRNLQKGVGNLVKIPLYIFGFVLLALVFAYFTFKLMSFSRTVDVPDLYGKSPIEANELLSKKGLNLKIEGEDYDSTIASGYVLRQDMPAGSRVKEQRGIKVILSKGPKVLSVPFVVGETVDKAEAILLEKGLKLDRIINVHSSSVEKDKVIAQKPDPDEKITGKITLIASSGPYAVTYYCPDFQGKTIEKSQELAEKLGLKLKITGSGENIISQKPGPGSMVKSGDVIELKLEGE